MSQPPPDTDPEAGLQAEIIDFFVSGVRILGLPKSVGEIFGLLFATADPLSFDDIQSRLRLSKGSTSQGLKLLRALGAVKPVYVPGERRDFFLPETELKKLVGGFLRGELQPHLKSAAERLDRMEESLKKLAPETQELLQVRVNRMRTWHSRTQQLLPLVESFLV